jgi:uncharacterized protein (DUF1697 family)
MPGYVAFLRGINVGRRRVSMGTLRELFEQLELQAVETFIASGNVLFSARTTSIASLESRIASHLEAALGYPVDTFVRTAEEVIQIGADRPFADDGQPGNTIHVAFMHARLPAAERRKLEALQTPFDQFRVCGREFYWLCRIRTSDSQVWKLPAAKAIELPSVTMRNLSAIRRLIAKHLKAP